MKGNTMYSSHKRVPCVTLRPGHPCLFMKEERGCTFNNNHCQPILQECKGKKKNCAHIIQFESNLFCKVYMNPTYQWTHLKECPLATHIEKEVIKTNEILDPRKAAKIRRRKG